MRFFFHNGLQLSHIDTFLVLTIIKMHILTIKYIIFAIGKSVQYRLNITHDYDMKQADQSCTGTERKFTSSIGNKQLSLTPTPGKCWTPLEPKSTVFFEIDM